MIKPKFGRKIFVSSTVYDLLDIRAEVENLIREAGLVPVMSDSKDDGFDPSIQANSIETCLENLRNCGAMILILSQRYGPTLEKTGISNLSATHLEYKEATDKGIPIYVYCRDKLMGEWSIWKKAKSKDNVKLNWVKENETKIFDLINERVALKKESVNWISTYTNSIDLKIQLKRDLKFWADDATFWNDVYENRIPILFAKSTVEQVGTEMVRWKFIMDFKNCGTTSALNIQFDGDLYKEKLSVVIIPPNEAVSKTILIDPYQSINKLYTINVSYKDTKGRKYHDVFNATVRATQGSLYTSFLLVDRKYLDSNDNVRNQE